MFCNVLVVSWLRLIAHVFRRCDYRGPLLDLYLTEYGRYSFPSGITDKNDYKVGPVAAAVVVKQSRPRDQALSDFAASTKYDDTFLGPAYKKPTTRRRGGDPHSGGADGDASAPVGENVGAGGSESAAGFASPSRTGAGTPPSVAPTRSGSGSAKRKRPRSSPASPSGPATAEGIFQHRLLHGLMPREMKLAVEARQRQVAAPAATAGTSPSPASGSSSGGGSSGGGDSSVSACRHLKSSPLVGGRATPPFNYGGIVAQGRPAGAAVPAAGPAGPPLPAAAFPGDDLASLTALADKSLGPLSSVAEKQDFLAVLRRLHVANASKRLALEEYKRQAALHYKHQAAALDRDQAALNQTVRHVEALIRGQIEEHSQKQKQEEVGVGVGVGAVREEAAGAGEMAGPPVDVEGAGAGAAPAVSEVRAEQTPVDQFVPSQSLDTVYV